MPTKKQQSLTFLTNHTHELCLINSDPNITIRDMA
ncbi:ArsR family transcriptional regulator, partial [Francisella tularensis subsp. holarctica]|nr:ArsR family transcriptional regulator [Francisella tularensis subsp. holarctica]